MKEFEITSCLPNLQREQGTILGVLRIQPFTPESVNAKIYWVTKADVPVKDGVRNLISRSGYNLRQAKRLGTRVVRCRLRPISGDRGFVPVV